MIVCLCHRVSDRDIAREVRAGCGSFEAVQDELRVGTACGACLEHAQSCFGEYTGRGGCVACPRALRCDAGALAA